MTLLPRSSANALGPLRFYHNSWKNSHFGLWVPLGISTDYAEFLSRLEASHDRAAPRLGKKNIDSCNSQRMLPLWDSPVQCILMRTSWYYIYLSGETRKGLPPSFGTSTTSCWSSARSYLDWIGSTGKEDVCHRAQHIAPKCGTAQHNTAAWNPISWSQPTLWATEWRSRIVSAIGASHELMWWSGVWKKGRHGGWSLQRLATIKILWDEIIGRVSLGLLTEG